MAQSRQQITQAKPIGRGLDAFRNTFDSVCEDLGVPSSLEALHHVGEEDRKYLLVALVSSLQTLPASRVLRSRHGRENLFHDLLRLNAAVSSDSLDIDRIFHLLRAVLDKRPDEVVWDAVYEAVTESTPPPRPVSSIQQTPWSLNTGSFVNSSEHRKYVDGVLKEELGQLYVDVPGFSDAYLGGVPNLDSLADRVFGQCKEGDNPLYKDECGWKDWPEAAREQDVLSWFGAIVSQLSEYAEGPAISPQTRRRPLAQPHQPIQGSTADRKLDVGFVDDSSAGINSKCKWSHILIPGELKSNPAADKMSKAWLDLGRYAREVLAAQDDRRFVLGFTLCGSLMRLWVFDRLGGIASSQFDINDDGRQFVLTILGFLSLAKEQLGFDPTIITDGDKRYIEIEREGQTERLIIDQVIKRIPCVAGRATTCWLAYRDGDEARVPLVIKDSWQFPERTEEGELLREAANHGVKNVARYYSHGPVQLDKKVDDIKDGVRRGLDVTQATNYRPSRTIVPPNAAEGRVSRSLRSSSAAGRKRSSSRTDAPLPPPKRTCSSSPVKGGKALENRVHRRVVVRDYGKPIYKASSRVKLLAALEGCIEGYESLHTTAGMLQCDISPNNLMINEDEDNPSFSAFLIDLDLAIKEQRETSSGARGKTGTRAFMAIGVLMDDEPHSFMHDLESFFWVLFWICVHYDGPNKGRVVPQFEKWNYIDTGELADLKKGIISDERDFLKTAESKFTSYYRPLASSVNRLRRKVFPGGGRWREPRPKLYIEMKEILREAIANVTD